MTQTAPAPKAPIRRFDIFAEWNRLKARTRHQLPESDARAYGLAVAKVVAARKFYGYRPEQVREWKHRARSEELTEAWWEQFGSDEEFEQKIVERMGAPFYRQVFQPAIQHAWDEGKTYEQIRDTLREEWNAQAPKGRRRS
jgi:hypothetical protein